MPMLATCQADIFRHVANNQPDMTTRAHFSKDTKTTSETKGILYHLIGHGSMHQSRINYSAHCFG